MKLRNMVGSIAVAALIAGCSSDSSNNTTSSDNTTLLKAYYLDSAIEGVEYTTTSGYSGETDASGAFNFYSGESVTFKIGDLILRQQSGLIDGQKLIETDDKVITLLQSIDVDGNPSNGITLNATVKEQLKAWLGSTQTLSLDANGNIANMEALQANLATAGITTTKTVTVNEARAHLEETIKAQGADLATLGSQIVIGDGSIYYPDYKNEMRKAPASAAAAEYHTGSGYGNTMFDSAENKCQNCHNELYDTWKDSMHGKSWTDPIFQSKFQDFLRTHINKIGEDKTAAVGVDGITGIVYSEAKFIGAAQTCIKCHAPGAYYAGDFKATLEIVKAGATTADLESAIENNQSNLATTTTTYDANQPASVVAVSYTNGNLYKATYQIGHKANKEGINCAFCHSIETPRLMGKGSDGDVMTLKDHIRVGPHGPAKAAAGSTLNYNVDASNPDMNKFFRLWGPEKYTDPSNTPKDAADFDINKAKDGRYTMASKDINGTNGRVHFTGGPFYGPYGATGIRNENVTDETNRSAQVNPHFDIQGNNHFGESGKGLCLSCHQRSAGAAVPSGEDGAGSFMELCSTQMAVSTGNDNGYADTASSPKCQKCHMERVEGTVLHQWASPDKLFTDKSLLTSHFYADDSEGYGDENPVKSGWYNSHAFLGASKTGHKTSAMAKIKSGFSADVSTSSDGNTLTVTTTFSNKTAHMFPGAHPMRRVLSRLIVIDADGNELNPTSAIGTSTFADAQNSVTPMAGKTLHSSAMATVSVQENGSAALTFPGKSPDLNGSAVSSEKFDDTVVRISGTDTTLAAQELEGSTTTGTISIAAAINSDDMSKFTRIYGRETGKKYDIDANASTPTVFVVRPGFDSVMVNSDSRLSPNETETYTLTYDISGKTGISTTYKIYYMQKGANGKFIAGADGWLDQAASDAKKLLVSEVFTKTVTE